MNPQSAYSNRTERLYENNKNNLFDFDATVIGCSPLDGALFAIELDRTAFFPEGGGQYGDTGSFTLPDGARAKVLRTDISEGRIIHTSDLPAEVGTRISASLDREKRLCRMQNHSGEHIISGLLHSMYGIENAGFHMTEGEVNEITIDTAAPLTADMLKMIESSANRVVLENRRINCFYPSSELLAVTEYRSKTELSGDIRLVEIEGVDICACCAPHVALTGEIGPIVIKGFMKYKKGVRITAACGEDALKYLRMTADAAENIAHLYSTRPEEAYAAVLRREELIKDKLAEISALRRSLLEYRLKEIAASVSDRSQSICIFESDCDAATMRMTVNEGMKLTDACFGVFSIDGDTARFTVGSQHHDLSSVAPMIREKLGGKGGGKGNMITGVCNGDESAIRAFFSALRL